MIRNLCAHAKSDIEFSSETLEPLAGVHAVEGINAARKAEKVPERFEAKSPVNGMLQLLQYLVPYLLLYSSKDWFSSKSRKEWRSILSRDHGSADPKNGCVYREGLQESPGQAQPDGCCTSTSMFV